MNLAEFERVKKRSKTFKHTSLDYVSHEELDLFEIIHGEDYMILKGPHKTGTHYHFAANNKHFIDHIEGQAFVSFVPREWVDYFSSRAFKIDGMYNDFFSSDLSFQGPYEFLNVSEVKQASEVTLSCYEMSRGFRGETSEFFAAWLEGRHASLEKDAHSNVIVLREDGVIKGLAVVAMYGYEKGPTLWIRELAVRPEFQKQGLGYKLMTGAMTYGKDRGARKAFLACDELNVHAIHLYEKFGFVRGDDPQIDMIRR